VRRSLAACLVLAALLGGCGDDGASSYTNSQIKAAYYRVGDEREASRPLFEEFWLNSDDHAHTNYVPREGIETCPQAQRANANAVMEGNNVIPDAGEPVDTFVVAPKRAEDTRTPSITQGALVFGTNAIAETGMQKVAGAVAKCPATYKVRGGPSPVLGTYDVSSREYDQDGWKGFVQQIAHTHPADDVYYEDTAHVIVARANVILYFNVTHQKIIGERSDSTAKAESVLRTVLKRLG
jgi:hypothetical protein